MGFTGNLGFREKDLGLGIWCLVFGVSGFGFYVRQGFSQKIVPVGLIVYIGNLEGLKISRFGVYLRFSSHWG